MRQTWVGTGWKMNKTLSEAEAYARTLRDFMRPANVRSQVFIVPPFTALDRVCRTLADTPVKIGAQNMYWEERGAFTGEISPLMVKDCGAHIVELGHSERRVEFGETDFTVNCKVLSALAHGLMPLVCVGETALEKEFGVARESVARQVKIALHGVSVESVKKIILAYEPVWAIGEKGTPSEPGYANAIHQTIRQAVTEMYGEPSASQVPILYGGSVNCDTAVPLVMQSEIDGLFIGRAAWNVNAFMQIIEMVEGAIREHK